MTDVTPPSLVAPQSAAPVSGIGMSPSEPAAEPKHRTVILPPQGWQLVDLRELWRFRELVFFLIWRDVKIRYKQTVLGIAWAVIQPAMLMVVFSVFFSKLGGLSSGDIPYPLFAFAGLLPWTFFSTAISQAAASVVGSERLITKIYFPRLAIPFSAIGAAVVDFVISLGLLGMLMAIYGYTPGWQILLAPVFFAIIAITALGLGTLLAALTVAYRDFRYIVPFFVQVGMYATPTIYMQVPADAPSGLKWWLVLNPLAGLIQAFRASLLGGPIPWAEVIVGAIVALSAAVLGCLYFRKVEDGFADLI